MDSVVVDALQQRDEMGRELTRERRLCNKDIVLEAIQMFVSPDMYEYAMKWYEEL